MTVIGTVQNGKVVLPPGVALPEGTEVSVEIHKPTSPVSPDTPAPADAKTDTGRRLLKLAGSCEGLPDDLSANLDHYLYGAPKR